MKRVDRLWIKVCGLRTRAAIEAAAGAGADAVGFVFHADSPRNLSVAEASDLQGAVPAGIERVAVFLRPTAAQVLEVIRVIRPDCIQADIEAMAGLGLPAGQRVLPVLRNENVLPDPPPAQVLFEGARSGTGERADWSQATRVARRTQVVLAGGLDAGNVADAVRMVRPFGVDVSSGVESIRGTKDPAMIREFVRAAREAGRALAAEEYRR